MNRVIKITDEMVAYDGWKQELWGYFFKCPNCGGTSIHQGYKYCPGCGGEIEWAVDWELWQ